MAKLKVKPNLSVPEEGEGHPQEKDNVKEPQKAVHDQMLAEAEGGHLTETERQEARKILQQLPLKKINPIISVTSWRPRILKIKPRINHQ
jgi:hypothetical protein